MEIILEKIKTMMLFQSFQLHLHQWTELAHLVSSCKFCSEVSKNIFEDWVSVFLIIWRVINCYVLGENTCEVKKWPLGNVSTCHDASSWLMSLIRCLTFQIEMCCWTAHPIVPSVTPQLVFVWRHELCLPQQDLCVCGRHSGSSA